MLRRMNVSKETPVNEKNLIKGIVNIRMKTGLLFKIFSLNRFGNCGGPGL